MTKAEYAAYEAAVKQFLKEEGVRRFITDGDPYWSSRDCDCCSRPQAGDRYRATGLTQGDIAEFSVCQDCVYYAEYGRLDDTTMMQVEAEG